MSRIDIEKISVFINIRLAVSILTMHGLSESNSAKDVVTILETLLQDDLGYIIKNKYVFSKSDVQDCQKRLGSLYNHVKDMLWLPLYENIPRIMSRAEVVLIKNNLIEIIITKDVK